jgi:hypothetical protein
MSRAILPKFIQRLPALPGVSRGVKQRALLVIAVALAVAVTHTFTYAGPVQGNDPALLRLLRGMVILKGIIGLGALTLIFWRMGRPVQAGLWTAYMVAGVLVPVAVTWLWSLHMIPVGSLFFYCGLAILAAGAWRDRQFVPWRR